MKPERRKQGEALTAQILAAAAPIMDGQPSELAIDVMCSVVYATVELGCRSNADRILVLRRFAARINGIADIVEWGLGP